MALPFSTDPTILHIQIPIQSHTPAPMARRPAFCRIASAFGRIVTFCLTLGAAPAWAQSPPASDATAAASTAADAKALKASQCGANRVTPTVDRYPETFGIKLENDLFAGTDRNYTSGVKFSWVSSNVQDFVNDPCLPFWVRDFNRRLEFIDGGSYASRNMSISLGQAIFTPKNPDLNPPDASDRPYAGWLYLGFGYNARGDDFMRSWAVNLGIVGPGSAARQTQELIHDARGIKRFAGWDYQLHNEFGAQVIYERKDKWTSNPGLFGLSVDAISHYGASLGNVATFANVGAEVRIGFYLPDDFGTSSIRPGGDNAAPFFVRDRHGNTATSGFHLFASVDGRGVVRNIFLDGNTFRSSAHVDKKYIVADSSLGIAWIWKYGKVAYAQYLRTKEFKGQEKPQAFGSLTLSLNY